MLTFSSRSIDIPPPLFFFFNIVFEPKAITLAKPQPEIDSVQIKAAYAHPLAQMALPTIFGEPRGEEQLAYCEIVHVWDTIPSIPPAYTHTPSLPKSPMGNWSCVTHKSGRERLRDPPEGLQPESRAGPIQEAEHFSRFLLPLSRSSSTVRPWMQASWEQAAGEGRFKSSGKQLLPVLTV